MGMIINHLEVLMFGACLIIGLLFYVATFYSYWSQE